MARTIAELSAVCQTQEARLDATEQEVAELRAAVVESADRLHEARADAVQHREQLAHARRDLDDERQRGRERDREIDALRVELAAVRQENALVRQQLQDHLKRVDTWAAWVRSLISGLIFAVLSLASGLAVALVKR